MGWQSSKRPSTFGHFAFYTLHFALCIGLGVLYLTLRRGDLCMAEYDLQSIAFPTLDESQIAQLARCTDAEPVQYPDGQTLIGIGDRDFKFFVVKSGEIEIIDMSGDEPT